MRFGICFVNLGNSRIHARAYSPSDVFFRSCRFSHGIFGRPFDRWASGKIGIEIGENMGFVLRWHLSHCDFAFHNTIIVILQVRKDLRDAARGDFAKHPPSEHVHVRNRRGQGHGRHRELGMHPSVRMWFLLSVILSSRFRKFQKIPEVF